MHKAIKVGGRLASSGGVLFGRAAEPLLPIAKALRIIAASRSDWDDGMPHAAMTRVNRRIKYVRKSAGGPSAK